MPVGPGDLRDAERVIHDHVLDIGCGWAPVSRG